MNSIAQVASFRETRNGLLVCGQTATNPNGFSPSTRAKRKKDDITEFSAASRLRFRRLIASSWSPDDNALCFGCCLTIPGAVISQERARKIWSHFSEVICHKSFHDVPFIWRVELQKRKQPHWHLVIWFTGSKQEQFEKQFEFESRWKSYIRATLSEDGRATWSEETDCGFEMHGVKWQSLNDTASAAGYLAPTLDHETKRKQEQLGWIGRQWGVVHRNRLQKQVARPFAVWGKPVNRIIARFKDAQDARRALGREYVGAGVGEHMRLPSVLFGKDAETLWQIVKEETE